MPPAWSAKDERQYRKIRKSLQSRDVSVDRAKEIAARTVNKTRRKQGRTGNSARSKGNYDKSLEARSRDELYDLAKRKKVAGRGRMSKKQLSKALSSGAKVQ
jgi:hypothetical protein